ncbi:MAG TPA: TonB-dependent receptor [Thermoanaerobaculia bacterium]|nr:TonB-dependent receptor [Thermoanaerobaculia bacterium]
MEKVTLGFTKILAVGLWLTLAVSAEPALAATAGSVRGTVTGPDGKPMGAVVVQLRNDITGFSAQTKSDAQGRFQFFNVPFNPYEVHVEVQGFQTRHLAIDVRSTLPVEVPVALALLPVAEKVEVEAEKPAAVLETDSSQSHVDIDKSSIVRAPAAMPSRGMEALVIQAPGFSTDENGRYHFQGAHSQQSYVVDGQPIADQIGITFSNSIDPGILQSAEVIYGNVPAEYGEKIAAVINLTTRSGLGAGAPKGDVRFGGASFNTYDAGASVGGGTSTFGYYFSLDAAKSNRFLDPVNFDNFNNHGDSERAFLRFDFATPDSTNDFRISGLIGRTQRNVPNTLTQEEALTDNEVQTNDWNLNLGWQSILAATTVLDVTGFARNNRYTYYGSPNDPSVIADSKRSLDNYGVQPTITFQLGSMNQLKAGGVFKSYPIQERFSFGITDPNLNDPSSPDYNPNLAPYDLTRGGSMFLFQQSKTITYLAGYLEDTLRLANLTAQIGFRYDHNSFPKSEGQLQPRIGLAYYIPATKTVLRASYNRIFETPEFENILFSSSQEAADIAPPAVQDSRELGGGVLLVPSEKQNVYDVGLQQAIGSFLRLDIDFWRRDSKNAGDQDQFENTGIVFPLAFDSGTLHGWNVRLDLAPVGGLHGYASVGHVRAIYAPPFAGGLFLDAGAVDDLLGGPFVIDHDEEIQVQSGLTYEFGKSGVWAGTVVRYDSGLVTDADPTDLLADPDNAFAAPYVRVHTGGDLDPNRIASRTIWNFSVGSDLTRIGLPLSLQLDVLNAFDKKGLYNVLSTFGGTHVIPPRTIAGRIRYTF